MTPVAGLLFALALDATAPRWRAAAWSEPIEPIAIAAPTPAGRIVTRSWVHVGVRGHAIVAPGELAAAVTLQVSIDFPR